VRWRRCRTGAPKANGLFEVKECKAYPVDPFLMRRISGMLFIIEVEWELSPLEAELLTSMIQGN
jgi:hypothetical protein